MKITAKAVIFIMNDNFLATPLPPDIADMTVFEAAAISASARRAGFAVFELDGAGMKAKPALMEHIARSLAFPGDFGENWDALIDYLGDMANFHKNNKILILIGAAAEIAGSDPALYSELRNVCGLACNNAREWSKGAVILKFIFIS
ncbi:MAG: hypothetical protein A2X34_05505 [Elusimicrobia bacterium GWC2_51_8]|nr:MAG: hypothetical protein A2X34_05505 [Elusimicrobia bacterium GWC2_51_8]OGR85548.1 MAG: hypothetical protein A2021_03190 [Elusimicrobia bacterium GWF2_52_66]HAF96244.1 hypothetical protein [Elusimicrobiota bacterium]